MLSPRVHAGRAPVSESKRKTSPERRRESHWYNVPMSLAESTADSIAAVAPSGEIDAHLFRFGLSSFRPGQREVISAVIGAVGPSRG